MDINTFGQFLNIIMQTRNLSAAKLAELTGNKSKTAVLRLLNDKSSLKTIMKFAESLAGVIELTPEESECMRHILIGDSISPTQKNAMDSLLVLFKKDEGSKAEMTCTTHNAEPVNQKIPLYELFKICVDYESDVIIEDIVTKELVFALDKIIHETAEREFSPQISHFFKADEGIEAKGKQLLSLMKLSTYMEYNAYEVRRRTAIEKRVIILTCRDGKRYMRLIEFYDVNKLYYTDTEINDIFYKHLLRGRDILIEHSGALRSEPMKPEQLLETLKIMAYYDPMPALQINSTPPYMFIPFDIQCRLFEDCNYIGLGKEHPYIKPIVELLRTRAEFIDKNVMPRKMIFTIDGLKSFFANGRTGDYFRLLGPLTAEECRITLKNILNKEGIRCRLLKKDYSIYDTEFIVFGDRNIVIYDPIWGWWKDSTMAELEDKRMARILTDFYNKVLWESCCYSESESRQMIADMLS